MKVENVEPVNIGSVKLKFNVVIPEWHITIKECKLVDTGSRKFVSFPSRTYKDKDGKTQYFDYLYMDKEAKTKFDQAVFSLLPKEEQKIEGNMHENEELPF